MKAASTATDQGSFSAIAATWSIDREGDEIQRGAFAKSIQSWQQSGKQLPLHWNQSGDAADVIGTVAPASMREAEEGLNVKGQLDLQDSDTAREAWRSMRNNAVSLSFGYLATKTRDRSDGVRELLEIDLFEISVVPHPANADTRFLELKAAASAAPMVEDTEFKRLKDIFFDDADRQRDQQRRRDRELQALIDEVQAKAARDERRNRPIQVKTFEV